MPKTLPVLLLLAGWLRPGALLAESPFRSVAVVDAMHLAPKVPNAHQRMRASLAAALDAQGWTVALVTTDCDERCLAALPERAGARYLLRLTGERNQDDGYDLVIELFRPGVGEWRRAHAYCDYCNVERMAEVAGRTAAGLLVEAESTASLPSAPPAPVPAPIPAPAPVPVPRSLPAEPPCALSPPLVTPSEVTSSGAAWIPWVLLGGGLVALTYGGWAAYQDGRSTGACSPGATTTCEHYSSKTVAIVALASGGVLAAGGLAWEIVQLSRRTSLSASPNHVALLLRF